MESKYEQNLITLESATGSCPIGATDINKIRDGVTDLNRMRDQQLLDTLNRLICDERIYLKEILKYLSEVDRRKLYAKQGYPSMYKYCLEKFHWCESTTYRRIQAARLSRQFPEILDLLKEGKINLTTLDILAPFLKERHDRKYLEDIVGKSKNQVEYFVATLNPNEDPIGDGIRKIPSMLSRKIAYELKKTAELVTRESNEDNRKRIIENATKTIAQTAQIYTTSGGNLLPHQRPISKIEPLSSQSVKIEFRASVKFAKLIERAKEVLGHKNGELTLEDIFIEALEVLLDKRDPQRKIELAEKKKCVAQEERLENKEYLGKRDFSEKKESVEGIKQIQQQPNGHMGRVGGSGAYDKRYISVLLRRDIYKRDRGMCAYVSPEGKRCGARSDLEVDHIIPWGLGGTTQLENLRLLCRTHNQWRARQTYQNRNDTFLIKEPMVMYG